MNKREDVLREAVEKNAEECHRWQTYLKENETAIENMNMFGRRLTLEVMIPVGKKAFMPGHLLHTNEVLVGHYQGYFSKCSTYKASEICNLRIKTAKERLKSLEIEADLWQNKLDKPYLEGAIPFGQEHEIVEEYNEETEKLWKEKHRNSVRIAKQKEKEERSGRYEKNLSDHKSKSNEDIFEMLEEAELIEELEQELNKLEIAEVNDETIRKLMSGEMKMHQEKKRMSHTNKTTENKTDKNCKLSNIVKKNDIKQIVEINKNNNTQANPVIRNLLNTKEEDMDQQEDETIPDEVVLIKEQANYLSPDDQIGFYDYQIEIVRQKLQSLSLRTQKELDEKIRLLNVLEYLEELLEGAEELLGVEELSEIDEEVKTKSIVKNGLIEKELNTNVTAHKKSVHERKCNQKRHISFSLKDETVEFKRNEAVTQMLCKTEKSKRDIKLNDNNEHEVKCKLEKGNSLHKQDLIKTRVQENLQFMSENQSKQDFDLVQQILQSSNGEINTLYIYFKHSEQEGYQIDSNESINIPGSPADIYDLYRKSQKALENVNEQSTLFINSYIGEDKVKVPVLREADRQACFTDPKSEFSNPFQAKSILKNISSVDKENRTYNKNKKSKKMYDDNSSSYYKVMNDVVEKHLTEPEPLPNVKFIDAHAPKKRVSRFKQMRQEKT